MKPSTLFFVAVIFACCSVPSYAEDWQILFDGSNLEGWKPSKMNTQFEITDGAIRGTSNNQTHFLYTTKEYSDFELELEVKLHDTDLNSGVQIRSGTTRTNDKGDAREVIHGPQVDLGKSPGRSGYIYGQGNRGWYTPTEKLIRNELMVNGQWNKVRVLAVGPQIQVWINGKQISNLTNKEVYKKYPQGVVALQVHGVKHMTEKPRHVSFRSIRIREIKK